MDASAAAIPIQRGGEPRGQPAAESSPAIDRALTVLELLAVSRRGLNVSEISRRLELPKSSTHRILLTLERRNCVQRDARTGRYHYGLKLVNLSRSALANLELREVARPLLTGLMQRTGLTVHMALLESGQAVLVERIEAPGLIKIGTWVGKAMDANSTAVGKALLAYLDDDRLGAQFASKCFVRHNHRTIVSLAELKEDLARVRELGYAVDDEEDELGVRCIGAAIFDRDGRSVAAISIVGTVAQIPERRTHEFGMLVRQFASGISAQLGVQPLL
jgi:DNA-binding IclR family transcriptional regulator